jgi:hypothetical protein
MFNMHDPPCRRKQTRLDMSYEERNAWVELFANVLIISFFGYRVWTLSGEGAFGGANGLTVWARTVLWMIPVSIVVTIVLTILFNIGAAVAMRDHDPGFVSDERDKRFGSRGMIAAIVVASAGWVIGLVLLALGGTALVTFNVILFAFAFGAFASQAVRLYFYRRGY